MKIYQCENCDKLHLIHECNTRTVIQEYATTGATEEFTTLHCPICNGEAYECDTPLFNDLVEFANAHDFNLNIDAYIDNGEYEFEEYLTVNQVKAYEAQGYFLDTKNAYCCGDIVYIVIDIFKGVE